MSSIKMITASLILVCMCGCSLFESFVDRRRNAGAQDINRLYVGKSKTNAPAICYNGLWTDDNTLQQMADAECQKYNPGTHAVKGEVSHFTCKLVLPNHAYFKCVK